EGRLLRPAEDDAVEVEQVRELHGDASESAGGVLEDLRGDRIAVLLRTVREGGQGRLDLARVLGVDSRGERPATDGEVDDVGGERGDGHAAPSAAGGRPGPAGGADEGGGQGGAGTAAPSAAGTGLPLGVRGGGPGVPRRREATGGAAGAAQPPAVQGGARRYPAAEIEERQVPRV